MAINQLPTNYSKIILYKISILRKAVINGDNKTEETESQIVIYEFRV